MSPPNTPHNTRKKHTLFGKSALYPKSPIRKSPRYQRSTPTLCPVNRTIVESPTQHDAVSILSSPECNTKNSQSNESQESSHPPRLHSWIWNHGVLVDGKWQCKLCKTPRQYVCTSTTHPARHLSLFHNILSTDRGTAVTAKNVEGGLAPIFTKGPTFRAEAFKSRLVEWVLRDRQPFRQVESESWRQMIACLRPEAISAIPKSGDTVRTWAINRFKAARNIIKLRLHEAISKIHISCDMWSSPNGHSMLGVVAHWCEQDKSLRSTLLGLPKVWGAHTGDNIAEALVDVLEQYELTSKLGYMMMDNATNNDTAVQAINEELIRRGHDPGMPWEYRRLRCSGHIWNLTVKKLLFGKDMDALEMNAVDFATWRQVGPVGKLHNNVRYIRASPQRRDSFLAVQLNVLRAEEAFMLRQNNDTRWNSTFQMIDRALLLQKALDTFIVAAIGDRRLTPKERHQLEADRLTTADWKDLHTLHELLQPFEMLTKEMQGNIGDDTMNGAIFDVLPAMDMLLKRLEDAKIEFTTSKSAFATCVNLAWKKLDEYYTLTDKSPVYMVAVLLDPRMKLAYFQHHWKTRPSWIDMARTRFEEMFNGYRKEMIDMENDSMHIPLVRRSPRKLTALMSWKFEGNVPLKEGHSELDDYLNLGTESDEIVPRKWWIANQDRFPILASMAWDIFAIPAMSAEVERVFSGYTP